MDEDILTTLKLLIIGESGVGKSSLLLRFTDDLFDPQLSATIGEICHQTLLFLLFVCFLPDGSKRCFVTLLYQRR